ncbi:diadenylate cyclase CdaA [Gloeocapsa sp. PCC 73106]|uniref:diadenylate cyclase CdaA n=1 Tax=Gloeocapsa sp. PCC 73106 TaxID=102232 RepID=UPI001EE67AB1|nr:diadenylate cyclase CdaA [Gloeocapsa sp. PCC 73106]
MLNLWLYQGIDIALALGLCLLLLLIIRDSRVRWLIQGLMLILVAAFISKELGLRLLHGVLEKMVLGGIVVIGISFQLELRRFLEKLGRGELLSLFQVAPNPSTKMNSIVDQLVEAVKELSQNRTGALIVLETNSPISRRVVLGTGVSLNADVSKELIQTIFQKKTLLHDGAMVIKNGRIASAGTILPLSGRTAPSQYGTRHRAAMGITEQVEDALCIVVSEETGSISLAENGILNRFITTTALKETLEARLTEGQKDTAENWGLGKFFSQGFTVGLQQKFNGLKQIKLKRWLHLPSSTSKDKK